MDKYLKAFSERLDEDFMPEALLPINKFDFSSWLKQPFAARETGKKQVLIAGNKSLSIKKH